MFFFIPQKEPEKESVLSIFLNACAFFFLVHTEPEGEEPDWVEVMVDILLSLLSQPSRHIRQVCRTVFSSICPHVTAAALTAILDVSTTHTALQTIQQGSLVLR